MMYTCDGDNTFWYDVLVAVRRTLLSVLNKDLQYYMGPFSVHLRQSEGYSLVYYV